MKVKFYQNYVVASKEEAFVILKAYIKGFCGSNPEDGFMDENICNVFTDESDFGRDKVDNSCCFLVTSELSNILDKWIECNNLSEISSLEGLDSLDEDAIVKLLHEKFVGSSNMDYLYEEDRKNFGESVSWYKDDVLFQKFWDLEKQ